VILSYADPETESFYLTGKSRYIAQDIQRTAMRRLYMLDKAQELSDLASPGNRLEALKGGLKGYHSIRINRQWRIVFKWEGGARDVEISDYH